MPTTENGVEFKVLRPSSGARVSDGDELGMFYQGWTIDPDHPDGLGTVFDGNYSFEYSFSPTNNIFIFELGAGTVISGWDEALAGRRVGQVLELRIPADLAYGSNGAGDLIPADTDLLFKVFIGGYIPEGSDTSSLYDLTMYGIDTSDFGDFQAGIDALAGREQIGYKGRDVIEGNEYSNALIGLGGKDKLIGGAAGDYLHGGAKRDLYVYEALTDSTRQDSDVILHMANNDRIDFRTLNNDLEDRGFDSLFFDASRGRLTGVEGQVIYATNASKIRVDANGDGRADMVIDVILAKQSIELDADHFLF